MPGRVRYPDPIAMCSPVNPKGNTIPNAVAVFEVLSASTAVVDWIETNEEYWSTSSIQRYVMLDHTRQAAIVFPRAGDDWVGHVMVGAAVLAMPEIGIELAIAVLYVCDD